MTGIASSVIREKMVSHILSEQFPSVEYCNMYQSDGKVGFNQKKYIFRISFDYFIIVFI